MVQDRLVELFQEWALIFQSDPSLSYLYDVYCELKKQNVVIFPKPSIALDQVDPLSLVASTAPPEWSDSPSCQRCRDSFTLTNRKHHCRKCGGTFCHLCSSNEMILLDMGINEPVRVCDSCYRSRPEKRHSRIFEDSQFKAAVKDEDNEAAQMKKAIELSLQEEKRKQPLCEDEEALKKAIEASLKESTNSRESTTITVGRLEHFNEIELENIAMFHQLIGRLIRTRPTISTEDANDLRNLAIEMERLQQRPIESESIRQQLDESIKGYRIVFGPITAINTPSSSSDTSNNLNQLRTEVITSSQQPTQSQTSEQAIQNQTAPIQPPKQLEQSIQPTQQTKLPENPNPNPNPSSNSNSNSIRNRLGSLSLEKQIEHSPRPTPDFTQRSVNVKPYASLSHDPIPFAHSHQSPPPQIISNSIYPQQSSTSISSASFSTHQPQHFHPPQQLVMCPEMTIHPHPVHSFTHENPYAKLNEDSTKKKDKNKKKKKKKEKKRSDSIDSENCGDGKKREHKEKEKTSKNHKKSKRSKDKETKEPKEKKESKEKRDKKEKLNDEKTKITRKKKNTSKSNNQESNDEGRKSPLNLIDL